jgi:hypothetical protein
LKLQKQSSRKVNGKEYAKWVVVIPPKVISKLKWVNGENLLPSITNDGLLIQKRPNQE